MNQRVARLLAWGIVVLFFALSAVGLGLQAITNWPYVEIGVTGLAIVLILVSVWPITGALVVSREPQHRVGWIMCLGITAGAIDMFAAGYAAYDTFAYAGSLPGVSLALVWLTFGGFPFALLAFTLLILFFPRGRLPSPRWAGVARIATASTLVYLLLQAQEPGAVDAYYLPDRVNPLGLPPPVWAVLQPVMWTSLAMLVLCYMTAVISLFVRLRQKRGDERQQLKWLAFPAFMFCLSVPFIVMSLAQDVGLFLTIAIVLGMPAIIGFPVATAFAIFRYRLYDIDFIIRQTTVYGLLSGALTVTYFSGIVLLQYIFPADSELAIIISTLVMITLFSPLRSRIQNSVDRRFYRPKYNARRALAAFSESMQDEVELERLTATLLAVVEETMKPDHISLWLKDTK